MLTEHNVLKRPVVLPPHGFSPAMVKAMSAVCTVVLPPLPFPSPEDPATASAGLNPCFFQAVQSDFTPDSNDARSKLFRKAYGKERRAAMEQMYAFDVANTTLPDDVRLPCSDNSIKPSTLKLADHRSLMPCINIAVLEPHKILWI